MQIERYIPPPYHPLHRYVQSVFYVNGRVSRELILPKANVDILFNLGDPICLEKAPRVAGPEVWRKTLVAGLQTGAIVSRPQGAVTILGISLHAATSRAVLPLPLSELTDLSVDGALLLPEIDLVWERLASDSSFELRCCRVLNWLTAHLEPPSQTDLVHRACALMEGHPDGRCVDEIVRASSVSSRHLRRLFREYVGIGPAQYLRLSRFIKALHLMNAPLSLTEIAHEALYCDQAHFCRDFKEISGVSPTQYRSEAGPAPGHVFYT